MTDKFFERLAIFLGLIGIILGLLIFLIYKNGFIFNLNKPFDPGIFGLIGDYVGGVSGTMLSAATVILVYLTYQSQKKELKHLTTESSNQNKLLQLQGFENTFFKLIEVQESINDNLPGINGKNAFQGGFDTFKRQFEDNRRDATNNTYVLTEYSKDYFKTNNIHFEHYFRTLYNIFKYIDENILLTNEEKQFYFNILKVKFNYYQIRMIFYYIIGTRDVEMKNILIKNNFFQYLSSDKLLEPIHIDIFNRLEDFKDI